MPVNPQELQRSCRCLSKSLVLLAGLIGRSIGLWCAPKWVEGATALEYLGANGHPESMNMSAGCCLCSGAIPRLQLSDSNEEYHVLAPTEIFSLSLSAKQCEAGVFFHLPYVS